MSAPAVARHGHVSGLVQGVAFRYYALDRASELGVGGWIRNLSDGRVEFHAQGAPSDVNAFLEWLQEGPPMAQVLAVLAEPAEVDVRLGGFEVRR